MSLLIVLEGLDAAGKATQSKLLQAKLDSVGRTAVLFSFPRYETEVGALIKRLLTGERSVLKTGSAEPLGSGVTYETDDADEALVLQALFAADKYDAVIAMDDAMAADRDVICDRWTPSALCFGEADGLDAKWLQNIQESLPIGDINIFIDVPEEEALRRRPQMRDRFERDREKQKVVRANYETLWAAGADEDPTSWVKVDGTGTIEEVSGRIWTHVMNRLELES